MTTASYSDHHRVAPPGVHLRSAPGRRAVLARPDGDLEPWSAQIRLTASDHPTSLREVDIDGGVPDHPEWPLWSTPLNGVLAYGQCHCVQVWGGIGSQPSGLVTIKDIAVSGAVADGIIVSHSGRVLIKDCAVSDSGRAGIVVVGPGSEVKVEGGTCDQLHYEEDYAGAHGVYLADGVTLTGRRVLTWICKSDAVTTTFRGVGVAAHAHLSDEVPPSRTALGEAPRLLVEDCEIEQVDIRTPRHLAFVGGDLGDVTLFWQLSSRQWAGSTVTLSSVTLSGEWITYGLGSIVLTGCTGDLVIDVRAASGRYKPGIDGVVVVTRDGVPHALTVGRHTI